MSVISATDILDELIAPEAAANTAFVNGVDDYLNDLIKSFDNTKSLTDIPTPLPYKVKQLAVAKCCEDICMAKFGGQVGVYFKGDDGSDRWYTKLKYYKKAVEDYEAMMTIELLTGTTTTAKSLYSIPLERG